jgi:hypothetical protein
MSFKRVKSVPGAPNDEDDAFDEDYEEEEERESPTNETTSSGLTLVEMDPEDKGIKLQTSGLTTLI